MIRFAIFDVDGAFVDEMAAHGYREVWPDELVKLRIHGVDGQYIEELAELGFVDLDLDDLAELLEDWNE